MRATRPFASTSSSPTTHCATPCSAQGADFVADTEQGLREESQDGSGSELRRRPGKEFLVRAHSFDGVRLGLDHAWLRACLSPYLLDVARAYLRMWPKLSYVDLWYTVPQPPDADRVASQLWHYDFDDKHLLKAFLYLDDVDAETGPFEYVAGSQPGGPHHNVRPWKPMGFGRVPEDEVQRAVPDEAIRTFTAPRGTIIFCNTSGLHRGGFATSRARVLATATYCSPASLAALSAAELRRRPLPAERSQPGGALRRELNQSDAETTSVFVELPPAASLALRVTRAVPAARAMPAIVPLPASSLNPAGSAPRAIDQRTGQTPPFVPSLNL